MKRSDDQFEIQERFNVCSNCYTVCGNFDFECSRVECKDHLLVEYYSVFEFFPDSIPMIPVLDQRLELPPINFFEAREIVNILACGDPNPDKIAA